MLYAPSIMPSRKKMRRRKASHMNWSASRSDDAKRHVVPAGLVTRRTLMEMMTAVTRGMLPKETAYQPQKLCTSSGAQVPASAVSLLPVAFVLRKRAAAGRYRFQRISD